MALDRVQHLRVPGQFLIGRIGDVVALGPVADRCQVDVDERRAFVAPLPNTTASRMLG